MKTRAAQEELSDYEKLRLEKIERNQRRLQELGLDKETERLRKSTESKKKTFDKSESQKPNQNTSTEPLRRSSRKRKVPDYQEGVEQRANGNDSDYSQSDVDDDEDVALTVEEDIESLPKPRKKARTVSRDDSEKGSEERSKEVVVAEADETGGLKLEKAKTGRSTCRKCSEKIEKGAPRVGMTAWIVGRQAITWQCPTCLLTNLTCGYEVTGRSRCKASGTSISKGDVKVGIQSHTATSFYKRDNIGKVLSTVLGWVPAEKKSAAFASLNVERIAGSDKLNTEDRADLQSLFDDIVATSKTGDEKKQDDACTEAQDDQKHSSNGTKTTKSSSKTSKNAVPHDPQVGSISRAQGRVEWKFGSHICSGLLIPSKETKTHCFARTHKGNVKTLAKGKQYWNLV